MHERKHAKEFDNDFSLMDREALLTETKAMVEELISDAKIKATSIMADAQKEADNLLEQTQEKIAKLINEAQLEAENIKEAAYLDGLEQGKKIGLAEVDNLVNEANQLVHKAFQEKEEIIKKAEPEIIDLAVKISEKLTRREITLNQDTIQFITSSLLELVQDAKEVTIKLNADDYTYLNNNRQELESCLTRGKLKLEIDNSCAAGDCLIISETGIVVARIDTQLEKISKTLLEVKP